MSSITIPWLGISLGAAAYFLLGALWFGQFAFGKLWDRAQGFDRPTGWKETPIYFVVPFLGSLGAAMAIALLLQMTPVNSVGAAMLLGALLGTGFSATASFTNAVVPTMPQPLVYGTITGGYHIVGAAQAAAIIYVLA